MAKYRTDHVYLNPKIKVISVGRGFFRSAIDQGSLFRNRLNRIFPGDKGVLAGSLWLGGSQNFSAELKGELKATGTSHIVAVSGYNVSILTITIFGLLRRGVSRRFAFISTITMLIIFCVMTGASASVVRASIMGGLYLLEKAVGRKSPPMHAIALAGLLMILFNPYAIYDLGFQLSFAAISGLVLLGEPLKFFVEKVSNLTLRSILGAGVETISAQIFALPILIFSFGTISVISPIVNALILPVVPLTMFAVLFVYFASLIAIPIGIFFGAFIDPILGYILGLIKVFSRLDFSVFALNASASWIVLLYIMIVCATLLTRNYIKEVKKKWLKIPNQ
jgi:competence protein ComEC